MGRWATRTHVGCVRPGNEDAVCADESRGIVVVSDGIGGEAGGEVASRIACEVLALELSGGAEGRSLGPPMPEALEQAVITADRAVQQAGAEDPSLEGMGATVVAALVVGGRVHIAHVGDSRAYLLRRDTRRHGPGPASPRWAPVVTASSGARLVCLTRDHTTIGELVEMGRMSRAEGRLHPLRGQLLRALGRGDGAPPDLAVIDLAPGDRLLLCSDGLWEMLDDLRLAALLEAGTPEEAATALLEAALRAGGDDNTTLVVIDPADPDQ